MEINAVILAAGKGTRMKAEMPKCAHIIIDKPMVKYVVDALKELKIKNIVTIIGYGKEKMEEILDGEVAFAVQNEQLGTAHAVKQAVPFLVGKDGITIIAIGDMPFIRRETFYSLIISHIQEGADMTVLTVDHPNPYGYGRIVRDEQGLITEIVEERDCNREQISIREINSAVYAIDTELLLKHIDEIQPNNNQNEYYLTDLVKIFNQHGLKVSGFKIGDHNELSGINNKLQLMEMEEEYQRKIIEKHLLDGVTIHKPKTIVIGKDVKIESGVEILPNTYLTGKTTIAKNSILGPNTRIHNCDIGEEVIIEHSIVENSIIKNGDHVGPFMTIKN